MSDGGCDYECDEDGLLTNYGRLGVCATTGQAPEFEFSHETEPGMGFYGARCPECWEAWRGDGQEAWTRFLARMKVAPV